MTDNKPIERKLNCTCFTGFQKEFILDSLIKSSNEAGMATRGPFETERTRRIFQLRKKEFDTLINNVKSVPICR